MEVALFLWFEYMLSSLTDLYHIAGGPAAPDQHPVTTTHMAAVAASAGACWQAGQTKSGGT